MEERGKRRGYWRRRGGGEIGNLVSGGGKGREGMCGGGK